MSTLDVFIEKGKKIGLEIGHNEGIEAAKIDIVKSLLSNTDFSVSKIALLTGVSEETVSGIHAQLDIIG